jgi:hypothetical protein
MPRPNVPVLFCPWSAFGQRRIWTRRGRKNGGILMPESSTVTPEFFKTLLASNEAKKSWREIQ